MCTCEETRHDHKATSRVHRLLSLEEHGGRPMEVANSDGRLWALSKDVGCMTTRNGWLRIEENDFTLCYSQDTELQMHPHQWQRPTSAEHTKRICVAVNCCGFYWHKSQ